MAANQTRIHIGIHHILGILLIITAVATIVWAQTTLKVTIIGDSTVCNYNASKYPQAGWGQVLQLFFVSGSITVNNRAIGGRSTRSFHQEGRWAEILPNLKKGEYVFIQFGHNDRDYNKAERYTDTTDYKKYLRIYVNDSRDKGAIPVLISPMNMNAWNGSTVRTVFREGKNNYRGAMMNVAAELSVPFIDLENSSVEMQKRMGQKYSAQFIHLGLDPGEYPNFPNGSSDGTHFQEMGANFMAKFVCEGIRTLENNADMSKLAALLKPFSKVNVSANKSGIGMITESGNTFPEGVSITLKVKPNSGEQFLGWFDASGKKVGLKNRVTFTMPSTAVSYVARFKGGTEQYTLSTTVAAGEGTIDPATGSFDNGAAVNITAVPATGWLFERWEGGVTGNDNPVSITMNENMTLNAYFIRDTANFYSVNATTEGGGSIRQNPLGTSLREGSTVTFTALPSTGWRFTGWTGTHTGTDTLYIIEPLDSDVTLAAEFIPDDVTHYEVESGTIHEALIEAENEGFSGSGYVNFNNEAGSSIEVPVYALEAGEKTVMITYSNGSTTSRQVSLLLNDSVIIETLSFVTTENWTTWDEKSITMPFSPGINTIRIVSVSSDGGPNIDKINIAQSMDITESQTKTAEGIRIAFQQGAIRLDNNIAPVRAALFSIDGRKLSGNSIIPLDGTAVFHLPLNKMTQGLYIMRIMVQGKTIISRFNVLSAQ